MPDYDPKSIPILDDVIEADILEQADAEDKHKAPIADITEMEDDLTTDDDSMNLFSTAPVELSAEDIIIEDSTEEDGHIDELDTGDSGPSIGTIESLDVTDKDDSSAYEETEIDKEDWADNDDPFPYSDLAYNASDFCGYLVLEQPPKILTPAR